MKFLSIELKNSISINRLYSFYYFYFAQGHIFPGEQHDFWELVYVNSGELEVTAGQNRLLVGQGEIILHSPNEFHAFEVLKENTSILVSGFECGSPELWQLCSKGSIVLNIPEKRLLASLYQEGRLCFGQALDAANLTQLHPVPEAPTTSLQMIRLYLEQLFILLLRDGNQERIGSFRKSLITEELNQDALLQQISAYMEEHLDGSLNFEKVRSHFNMSATSLKNFFASQTGMGVVEYYQRLRVNKARRLLRAGTMNITEISELLGYSSIHSFSRQFRRLMHMSPTEYLKSIHYEPL